MRAPYSLVISLMRGLFLYLKSYLRILKHTHLILIRLYVIFPKQGSFLYLRSYLFNPPVRVPMQSSIRGTPVLLAASWITPVNIFICTDFHKTLIQFYVV